MLPNDAATDIENSHQVYKSTELLRNNHDVTMIKNTDIENIINSVFGTNDKEEQQTKCPMCDGTEFIEDHHNGMVVCKCGQVIGDVYDLTTDRKQHDADDGDNVRNNIIYNKLLPQSSLGTIVTGNGKIKKMHIWNSMPYKDRSLIAIFKFIHNACIKLGIVKRIEDDARIICWHTSKKCHSTGKNIGKPIITRGDNRKGIIMASIFLACRRNGETRSIKEIASVCKIAERDVNKGLKSLLNILLNDDILKDTGTSKITDFIKRKCDELQIRQRHADIAVMIAENIEKLNIASNHTTYSLAAASIMLMADINDIPHVTRKKLSDIFGVSDVTIGKSYAQIEKYRDVLINPQKVSSLVIKINNRKEKRNIKHEVWVQMKRFNVNTSNYISNDPHDMQDEITNKILNLDIMDDNLVSILETINNNFAENDKQSDEIYSTLADKNFR